MNNLPKSGDKVYIDLNNERLIGVIVSEISGKMFNNPGFIYTVRLMKDGEIFVKPIYIHHLSERDTVYKEDYDLLDTPKLASYRKGYSKYQEYQYFYKHYSHIRMCKDRVGRRIPNPYASLKHQTFHTDR
jgi:hypothetical protein